MIETKRILLVDDNVHDVELTLSALEENNLANEVVVVRDGEEALDYLYGRGIYRLRAKGHPVVILLDIKMPKLSGLEVLERIKADPQLSSIPVVMLTSSREESDLLRSYGSGVNAYVVKPVDFADFIAAIRTLGVFWALINETPPVSAEQA
ncbi:CheY-like chemotaxis protein [Deinobacterium chartae]|uniref:CheY-like chemotaxis protein n=1 Tax=Deinobacterium chartae TaxID=521158 RepID=A0A841HYI9_9DEIO|nr:response regulator [Deinobacterium chartae]MBB6097724.1 CheY-like chemotaxis protein [Deinobacterium chartae]